MTYFLPLHDDTPLPSSPSFLVPSTEPTRHLNRVIKAILKARRIAVVCGAGISVQAGIPDFRSSDGLFQSLKKDNPALTSGKDLFDVSVFNAEDTTALFCQMIAQLSELSESAQPTPFHKLLRALDVSGKLLRVYTQNIDALESKSGLSFGIPKLSGSRSKVRHQVPVSVPSVPGSSHPPLPPVEIPRVIPLHGTLETLHCVSCTHAYPLRDHLELLNAGIPPHCPECTALEETRQLIGKRSRGVGKLRPSVVLYNEEHKNGEQVGEAVRKDLVGNSNGKGKKRSGPDLLLVVGTSLRVPGTKRIVREFSKAVRSRSAMIPSDGPLLTPAPSPRRSPVSTDEEGPITSIYLNLDFPVPTREWEGVFDIWVKGDAQDFANAVRDRMEKEARAKEAALERKRKREEMEQQEVPPEAKKKKSQGTSSVQKRKREGPPSPVSPLSRRKIKIVSDETKNVTRLTSSSDDEPDGYARQKVYLRIPPRSVPPPISSPTPIMGRFLVPQVVIDTRPPSLSCAQARSKRHPIVALPTPTPSPTPLTKFFPQKKSGVCMPSKKTWSRTREPQVAKRSSREEEATLSSDPVCSDQCSSRERGGDD